MTGVTPGTHTTGLKHYTDSGPADETLANKFVEVPLEKPKKAPGDTIHWDGSVERYSNWIVGLGVVAAAGFVGAGIAGGISEGCIKALSPAGIGGAVAGALAVGAGTYFLMKALQNGTRETANLPPANTVRALPEPTPGDLRPMSRIQEGKYLAHWEGSDTRTVIDYDSEGHVTGSHTETDWYDGDLHAAEQVGELNGYATKESAIHDAGGRGRAVVIKDSSDRWFIHKVAGNWHDLDEMNFKSDNIAALIRSDGYILTPDNSWDGFDHHSDVDNETPASSVYGEDVASFKQPGVDDETIVGGSLVGPRNGFTSLADALADAKARPAGQGIVLNSGRFYTVATESDGPDKSHMLVGLETVGKANAYTALEVHGDFYVPTKDYWVAPNTVATS